MYIISSTNYHIVKQNDNSNKCIHSYVATLDYAIPAFQK